MTGSGWIIGIYLGHHSDNPRRGAIYLAVIIIFAVTSPRVSREQIRSCSALAYLLSEYVSILIALNCVLTE